MREFECKDGTHTVKLDSSLLYKLQKLRDEIGKPIIVTSGYRTKEYNNKIGGAKNSQHMLGKAADIKINGLSPDEIAIIAEKIGFGGIGIYKTFVHLDVRQIKTRWRG